MKKLLMLGLLTVVASAFAAPVAGNALSGKITDWPAGKTGEMQLRLLDYLTDQPDTVLATTTIDTDGNFKLALPDAKALAKVLPDKDTSYSYGGVCSGSLMLEPAAQINIFDLRAFIDGKEISNVKYRTSRTPWPGMVDGFKFQELVFASVATSVDGGASCDLADSPYYDQNASRMRVNTTANLSAGWNVLSGTDTGSKTTFSDEAMPKNAFWHIQVGYGGAGMTPEVTADKQNIRVAALKEGMPAAAAGVKVGDLVLAVDDLPADPNNLPAMAERVRGEEGTTVTLTIKRGDQTLKIPIKRQWVQVK